MREIVVDTETTGRSTAEGHRIIEIGCIELINRRITNNHYHQYVNPQRESEAGALAVHGITQEFLADKPLFINIVDEFLEFIKGAQLIIHNAPFDVGFFNHELQLAGKKYGAIADYCTVLDTLPLARQMHPGQRNSLDALCKRYSVNNSHRNLHGALLDAELLTNVYLAMTGGQTNLFAEETVHTINTQQTIQTNLSITKTRVPLPIIQANEMELSAHQERLVEIAKKSPTGCLWEQ